MLRKLSTQKDRGPLPGYGPPVAIAPAETQDFVPRADAVGTGLAIVGCILTAIFMQGALPSDIARFASYGFGLSLGASVFRDWQTGGFRNIIRSDVLALVAFYFLVFFEFLFPQAHFNDMVSVEAARDGILATLIGAAGLLLGRHCWPRQQRPLEKILTREVPAGMLIAIFLGALLVGYMHMLIAVNFNVVEMVEDFMKARFTQPWGRGKLGDWKALIGELAMLIYLIPPLAGIILARRQRYSVFSLALVVFGLLFTLFYGFTSGTRNVFASYLVTLLIGYAFSAGPSRRRETLIIVGVCAGAMVVATPVMLAFRTVGIKFWLSKEYTPPPENKEQTVFVDYNLLAICVIMDVFPHRQGYLGLEIPYNALIRPIPRAIWPGKPEGLTFSIEDAMGVENMTISATFVGEAYMAGGLVAVFIAGGMFGALFGWWNQLGSPRNSELGILIYASGFFSAVISMRSMFAFTTALMPTLLATILAALLVRQLVALERRLARALEMRAQREAPRLRPPPRPPR